MSSKIKKKNKGYYRLLLFTICIVVGIGSLLPVNFWKQVVYEAPLSTAIKIDVLPNNQYEIPQGLDKHNEQIIEHLAYTVSYNHDWHLPNWVAYELTSEELYGNVERSNHFTPDPLVHGDPIVTYDYTHSGYDRGHMAPAADMKWSEQAMRESFYMTNICPQNQNLNRGDWNDLEELARDWARKYGSIYIVCGPIVAENYNTIGQNNKIAVPSAFYKVFLHQTATSWTSIGFVMPNQAGSRPLMSYMMSVNDIEDLTQIDFFHHLPDEIEEHVEDNESFRNWNL